MYIRLPGPQLPMCERTGRTSVRPLITDSAAQADTQANAAIAQPSLPRRPGCMQQMMMLPEGDRVIGLTFAASA